MAGSLPLRCTTLLPSPSRIKCRSTITCDALSSVPTLVRRPLCGRASPVRRMELCHRPDPQPTVQTVTVVGHNEVNHTKGHSSCGTRTGHRTSSIEVDASASNCADGRSVEMSCRQINQIEETCVAAMMNRCEGSLVLKRWLQSHAQGTRRIPTTDFAIKCRSNYIDPCHVHSF